MFDTVNIYNNQPYQLPAHIDRLLYSAKNAKIPDFIDKDFLCEKITELVKTYPNSRVRFFVSGSSIFYILIYEDVSQAKPVEVEEATVSVPPKPKFLASIKTTNYLSNVLTVLEARSKGGYMGISLDDFGYLAESAIANVAVVYNKKFLTPLPNYVLEGTTVKRVLEYCKELINNGDLETAERENISLDMAYQSSEMMLLGGDSVIAITKLDNHIISEGIGPITSKISQFLAKDKIDFQADS